MIQIAEAVAYAHGQGIMHRDLKPGNILVTSDGRVKLVDFGLAKLIQSSVRDRLSVAEEFTTTGSILGTVSYLSPEQARSAPIDERSDLFSLGIIFYEILTGRRPHGGDTPVSTLMAIIQSPPAAFPASPPVPEALQQLVLRLLEKSPDDRYQSAAELLEALRRAAGLPADPTVRFTALPRLRRRRRRTLALAGPRPRRDGGAGGLVVPGPPRQPAPAPSSRIAIFVYPVRTSGDEKSRFLADLITGEVIATLSRSPDLRILYLPEGRKDDAAAAEKVLQREDVRYVIDGSLLLAGDQLKVSMKMIDRTDSSIRWSDSLRGAITDVYAIPARIASSAAFVAGVYVAANKMSFPGREAFDLYTQGDILLRRYDPAQLPTAIECFQKCIDVAPDFLPAYARIVFGYMQYHNQGVSYDPAYLDSALVYIRQGLAKDPRSPALRTALAWHQLFTRDYAAAAETLRRLDRDGASSHRREAARLDPVLRRPGGRGPRDAGARRRRQSAGRHPAAEPDRPRHDARPPGRGGGRLPGLRADGRLRAGPRRHPAAGGGSPAASWTRPRRSSTRRTPATSSTCWRWPAPRRRPCGGTTGGACTTSTSGWQESLRAGSPLAAGPLLRPARRRRRPARRRPRSRRLRRPAGKALRRHQPVGLPGLLLRPRRRLRERRRRAPGPRYAAGGHLHPLPPGRHPRPARRPLRPGRGAHALQPDLLAEQLQPAGNRRTEKCPLTPSPDTGKITNITSQENRMRVGLTYDLRDEYLAMGYSLEETAEFDKPDTVEGIEGALRELGHDTDRIGHARTLAARLVAGDRWDLVFNIAEGMHGVGREALVPALLDA